MNKKQLHEQSLHELRKLENIFEDRYLNLKTSYSNNCNLSYLT